VRYVLAHAVVDVRVHRRMRYLELGQDAGLRAVKDGLTTAQRDWDDAEIDVIGRAGSERLPHRRRATGDPDVAVARDLPRSGERDIESVGHEVKRRTTRRLNRVVLVVAEHENRGVVRRVVPPLRSVEAPCTGLLSLGDAQAEGHDQQPQLGDEPQQARGELPSERHGEGHQGVSGSKASRPPWPRRHSTSEPLAVG
jgi:hypothetical protein